MEITNTFTVPLPVDQTWDVLTDLERVAPCMPGAALLGVEGDEYSWLVKLKVGPVAARYQGIARFLERDESARRAVIQADGEDLGGQGGVAAKVTATLTARGEGTAVLVRTDLDIAGRVAQFGRGVITDVSNKLFGQFVERLEDELSREIDAVELRPATPTTDGGPVSGAASRQPAEDVEPIDLLSAAGSAHTVAKLAAPAAGAVMLAVLALGIRRTNRRQPRWSGPQTIQLFAINLPNPNPKG